MADLRLWPGSIQEDKEPPFLSHQRCLVIDDGTRLRAWVETQPSPRLFFSEVYAERNMVDPSVLGQPFQDNRHRYLLEDGRTILVGRGGGCKCGILVRWEPPADDVEVQERT